MSDGFWLSLDEGQYFLEEVAVEVSEVWRAEEGVYAWLGSLIFLCYDEVSDNHHFREAVEVATVAGFGGRMIGSPEHRRLVGLSIRKRLTPEEVATYSDRVKAVVVVRFSSWRDYIKGTVNQVGHDLLTERKAK